MLPTIKVALVTLVLGLGVGVLIGYELAKGGIDEPIPTSQLPPKTVVETVVKEIKVPGPVRVVERVHLVTKTVEVPVEKIKEVATFIRPIGRVRLDANKFEGTVDGKLRFGWKGTAICEFRPEQDPLAWTKLVESPFDLTESHAETTIGPPRPPSRTRFDLALGITPRGGLLQAGVSRRISHKTSVGRALMPDWFGASVGYGGGETQLLATVSKEF